jgi:hypothetical protein
LRTFERATIQRCCVAIAIGVLAVATLRVAESALVSNGERGHASVVATTGRPHGTQAPHLAGLLGAAALVAITVLSRGVAAKRRDVPIPAPPSPFRRRGPPQLST